MFLRFMASRMTAKASCPTGGAETIRVVEIPLVDLAPGHELFDVDGVRAFEPLGSGGYPSKGMIRDVRPLDEREFRLV